MQRDWKVQHKEVISDLLKYINRESKDYILKGGTSLMMCYGLDRFSEDIDLDSINHNQIKKIIDEYCESKGFSYRTAKDTDTTQRFYLNYGNDSHPLKVEISYRNKFIDKDSRAENINNILVYNINEIFMMKLNAYTGRDRIRDLYDICFIANNYWDKLLSINKSSLSNALSFKGLEQFDYLVRQQTDALIDNNKLAEDFLIMYEKAGLLLSKEEKQLYVVSKEENIKALIRKFGYQPTENLIHFIKQLNRISGRINDFYDIKDINSHPERYSKDENKVVNSIVKECTRQKQANSINKKIERDDIDLER